MTMHTRLLMAAAALMVVAALMAAPGAARTSRDAAAPGAPAAGPEPAILARAEAATRLGLPSVGELHMDCWPVDARTANGAPLREWQIVSRDADGKDLATAYIAADTASLMSIYCASCPRADDAGARELRAADASAAAWRWLRALGIADHSRGWRLAHPPRRVRSRWLVRWVAPGWQACVVIHAKTADLALANCTPVASASTAPPIR